MRGERIEVKHRIKGKAAIEKSIRSLLIRTHRFGRMRATAPADRMWTARMIDALTAALDLGTRDEKGNGA